MDLNISEFSEAQREALLDLLVLASYLDRHLGSGEDERVKRLLLAMGCATPYDRQREFDASVNRTRQYAEGFELVRARATKLGRAFTRQEQCRQVCALLQDLISCDGHVTAEEERFMQVLRDAFQL